MEAREKVRILVIIYIGAQLGMLFAETKAYTNVSTGITH